MTKLLARALLAAVPLSAVLALFAPHPALAHERRAVGAYQLVVGWGDEPAYSTLKNSVQLTLSEADGGPPVTDLGDSLKVEVIKGADRTTLPLEANFRVGIFGTPGDYRAWVVPTRPGRYTFRFTGTIRGQHVDESFTSSPTTFDDVHDVGTVEFPAKDPTTGELANRIEREVPRLERRVDRAEARSRTAVAVALVLGAAGVVLGSLALVAAARRRPPRRIGLRAGPSSDTGSDQAASLAP